MYTFICFAPRFNRGLAAVFVRLFLDSTVLASQCGDIKRKIKTHFGLGNAFSHIGDLEPSARGYFLKAITATRQINDRSLRKEAHANLGSVYYKRRPQSNRIVKVKTLHMISDRKKMK